MAWLNDARLEGKTTTYYRNGWRMLKATAVADMQVGEITGDWTDRLKFRSSAGNANCSLRTLRHKAEERSLIGRAPKVQLMKEHGRSLTLDDDAERKLLAAANGCKWRKRTRDLLQDVVILMKGRAPLTK